MKSLKHLSGELYLGKKQSFKIREVIDEVWDVIKLKYRGGEYNRVIYGNENLTIESYREAYFQIFRNFMENSIVHGFMLKKGGTITISYKKIRNKHAIYYKDDGRQIDSCNMKKIFDPFFPTRGGKGNIGIGLNIVQNLVIGKLHGSIQVNNLEKGVEFKLRLPEFKKNENDDN